MTYTYRFQLKGYYKGFFWERIEVSSEQELISKLKAKREEEALKVGDDALNIELSPHIINKEEKYEELKKEVCQKLNNQINRREKR